VSRIAPELSLPAREKTCSSVAWSSSADRRGAYEDVPGKVEVAQVLPCQVGGQQPRELRVMEDQADDVAGRGIWAYGDCDDGGCRGGDRGRVVEDISSSAAGVQETFRLCHERQSQFKADQLAASPCRRPGAQLGVSVRLGGSVGLHKVLSAVLRNRRSQ
jgi:hypothetical protein